MKIIREALVFVPNEYCLSLDMSNLEVVDRGIDFTVIYILVVIGILILATAVFAVIFIRIRNKKIEQTREQRKNSK